MATIDFNCFLLAAQNGDISILKHCLENGIDIHLCNDLALRSAKENGQTEAVIFLQKNGANPNILDDLELRSSSSNGDFQAVKYLLEKGTCSQEAKLYAMYNAILYGYEEIVILLLKAGISPTDNDGAILKVLKLCKHYNIIALFENYLK